MRSQNFFCLASTAESALKSFLSGGVGGACTVLVGHPLDLIKVRNIVDEPLFYSLYCFVTLTNAIFSMPILTYDLI